VKTTERDVNWLKKIEPGTLFIIKKPIVAIGLDDNEIAIDENEIIVFLACKKQIFDIDLSGLRPVTCIVVLYEGKVYHIIVHACPPQFDVESYYFYLKGTIALLTDFEPLNI
jgi:hypothetical protein